MNKKCPNALSTQPNWAAQVADSLLTREGLLTARWSYDYGVIWRGLAALYDLTADERYENAIRQGVDSFLSPDGRRIRDYHPEECNLDYINNGKLLLYLYQRTGDARYRNAADLLRAQLDTQPRTPSGGFWHKLIYPNQMWLDGLYMAEPFYAQYTAMFGDAATFDDIAHQFRLVYDKTFDAPTGLCRHAWDETRESFWCDPQTGQSKHVWGRAMGWYMAALVDTIEHIPATHAAHAVLSDILRALAPAVVCARDAQTGVWMQVMDCPGRPGNYPESSASCLLVYALLKGARLGVLEREYAQIGRAAYADVVTQFIQPLNGQAVVTKCCQVGGLGGAQRRDGSFAYYMSEAIICNDLKGTGAFIQAGGEAMRA
ncbi:MAG: glycoside hydrolase family 88 protein [Oscillospiraceae bacterium]|jgi:unsaturated rhamnogalacturonyl hydrolase|nr:glycoside hydrolase family 88 protein [Oscillospiraceae bacterium]